MTQNSRSNASTTSASGGAVPAVIGLTGPGLTAGPVHSQRFDLRDAGVSTEHIAELPRVGRREALFELIRGLSEGTTVVVTSVAVLGESPEAISETLGALESAGCTYGILEGKGATVTSVKTLSRVRAVLDTLDRIERRREDLKTLDAPVGGRPRILNDEQVQLIENNPNLRAKTLARKLGVGERTITRYRARLRREG